jgi:hypothetical protein
MDELKARVCILEGKVDGLLAWMGKPCLMTLIEGSYKKYIGIEENETSFSLNDALKSVNRDLLKEKTGLIMKCEIKC